MIVKKTTNIDDIKAILCNAAIYGCISNDSSPIASDFEPPITEDYLYIGGYIDGKIFSIMVYHGLNDGEELHIQVLPEFRKEHAKYFAEKALKFRNGSPLYATIPDLYPNVISFAESFGFKVINTIAREETKNGAKFIDNVLKYMGD